MGKNHVSFFIIWTIPALISLTKFSIKELLLFKLLRSKEKVGHADTGFLLTFATKHSRCPHTENLMATNYFVLLLYRLHIEKANSKNAGNIDNIRVKACWASSNAMLEER